MAKSYGADDIEIFDELDGVRRRSSMYIGSSGSSGLYQCIKEIVDNAADEAQAGRNTFVGAYISDDCGTITVWDKGGGIPVEKHKKTGRSTLIELFTKLHAGGKFGGKAYDKGSKGVHGVGASVTNALSTSFEVWTYRNDTWYYHKFVKGKPVGSLLKATKIPTLDPKPKQGTIVKFTFDYSCFSKNAKLNVNNVREYVELLSYLHPGVEFAFQHKAINKSYKQTRGLVALLERETASLETETIGKPFVHSGDGIDLALTWSTYSEEQIKSYVNGSATQEGGTHVRGLMEAINESLKTFKGKRDFTPADLRTGLVAVINIAVVEPEFSSQTKERLTTSSVVKRTTEELKPALFDFFSKNKSLVNNIIKRAEEFKKLRTAFAASKAVISKLKNSKHKALLPSKFADATSKNVAEREIFLVEGDSAGGTAKLARNAKFQAILKLKGKPPNGYGSTAEKIFANAEVIAMLQAIGYEAGAKNPTANIKFSKIIMLADPDIDGKHITVLLLSIFHRLAPQLFQEGKIYVIDTPLFNTFYKGKRYFGKSVQGVMDQLPANAKLPEGVQRIKGLGEIKPEVLETVAFGPTRVLTKVGAIKDESLVKFINIVGDDASARRQFLGITEHHT